MKVYIERNELWPHFYIFNPGESPSEVQEYDLPEDVVVEYRKAVKAFHRARLGLADAMGVSAW